MCRRIIVSYVSPETTSHFMLGFQLTTALFSLNLCHKCPCIKQSTAEDHQHDSESESLAKSEAAETERAACCSDRSAGHSLPRPSFAATSRVVASVDLECEDGHQHQDNCQFQCSKHGAVVWDIGKPPTKLSTFRLLKSFT